MSSFIRLKFRRRVDLPHPEGLFLPVKETEILHLHEVDLARSEVIGELQRASGEFRYGGHGSVGGGDLARVIGAWG
jgi:hypothetical protein